jgi:hypothetical protein
MIEEVLRARCHISFDHAALERLGVPLTIIKQQYPAAPANQDEAGEHNDEFHARDAVQKMSDELKKVPLWWILEVLPTSYSRRNKCGECITSWW